MSVLKRRLKGKESTLKTEYNETIERKKFEEKRDLFRKSKINEKRNDTKQIFKERKKTHKWLRKKERMENA